MTFRFLFSRLTPSRVAGYAVLVLATGLFLQDWPYTLSDDGAHNLKGGVSTVGAERVLRGEIPYRDFWTIYAPGHFYLLATLFRIFGTDLVVERLAAAIVCGLAAWICYWLAFGISHRVGAAAGCAVIFVAGTLHTGYYKTLGSYPPAMVFVFGAFALVQLYFGRGAQLILIAAGVCTGIATVFKHDVGGYTAISLAVGLIAYHAMKLGTTLRLGKTLVHDLTLFSLGFLAIVLPPLIGLSFLAGPDMIQNLIVFPLTDFKFARPEWYPPLLPFYLLSSLPTLLAQSSVLATQNVFYYLMFAVPFVLFMFGVVATLIAFRRGNTAHAPIGMALSTAFLFHYSAAHVQINTHIITLSVYGAILGLILLEIGKGALQGRFPGLVGIAATIFFVGWLVILAAQPIYAARMLRQELSEVTELEKISRFRVSPVEAEVLEDLVEVVQSRVPVDRPVFVGLHRHDVIVIGDVMAYFILDRPIATKYHELHPAIADTEEVQKEIIAELEDKEVRTIVLRHIFSDQVLDRVKSDFQENLPEVGASGLDDYIRQEYRHVESTGPYEVWIRY